MIQKFLQAKHWQLFTLTVGIPLLFQIYFISSMVSAGDDFDEAIFMRFVVFILIISILFILVYYGWLWSVGVGLQEKLPQDLKMNVKFFKWAIIFPLIYMVLIFGGLGLALGTGLDDIEQNLGSLNSAFVIIVPIHLFSVFCSFYQLYFVSKTIKTVEKQRPVSFGEYIREFFLIWLYPIGIWFIQPKVNELAQADYLGGEDDYTQHIL